MSESKVMDWREAVQWRRAVKEKGGKLVFTNGCFDLLHMGHIKLLEEARDFGDCLVVGLNSDSSVRRIKGKGRPVRSEKERAEVLAGLSCVDAVVIFDGEDPLKLILHLKPDVLVKGGDWPTENIVGADEVKSWKGEVYNVEILSGRSTTSIIDQAIELERVVEKQ